MWLRMRSAGALVCALLAGTGVASAQEKNVRELLENAERTEPSVALVHLRSALAAWPEIREAPAEKRKLGERWIRLFAKNVQSARDVERMMDDQTAVKVDRQLLFQRYMERRYYDRPLPFVVILDCVTGLEPVVRGVFVAGG